MTDFLRSWRHSPIDIRSNGGWLVRSAIQIEDGPDRAHDYQLINDRSEGLFVRFTETEPVSMTQSENPVSGI